MVRFAPFAFRYHPNFADPDSMATLPSRENDIPILSYPKRNTSVSIFAQRTVIACIAFFVIGICCVPFDVALARFFCDGNLAGEFRALLRRAETFGHAYGVIAIIVSIWFTNPTIRVRLPFLVVCTFGAGLLADLFKVIFWRVRPRSFDLDQPVWESFCGTLFSFDVSLKVITDSAQHSLPSAHTAMAVAFAVALGRIYPHGRNWFFCLAFLCALNRVDGGAHFVSDACWGASVACLSVYLCDRSKWLNRWKQAGTLSKSADRVDHRSALRAA